MTDASQAKAAAFRALTERALDEVLPGASARPAEFSAALRYAVGTGGKRIRPLVCLGAAEAAGGTAYAAAYAAAAIELLHNYTLVHDDLPAMDNDTLRRGQPTVWARFGEPAAILAGDALQALAFAAAARVPSGAGAVSATLAGYALGVVQGQVEDIAHTGDVPYVYTHKTADLFMASAVMGAQSVGADGGTVERLRAYARNLGLAFQYEDDLLDGDAPYAREETARLVREATDAALAALAGLPGDASFLRELAEDLVGRLR